MDIRIRACLACAFKYVCMRTGKGGGDYDDMCMRTGKGGGDFDDMCMRTGKEGGDYDDTCFNSEVRVQPRKRTLKKAVTTSPHNNAWHSQHGWAIAGQSHERDEGHACTDNGCNAPVRQVILGVMVHVARQCEHANRREQALHNPSFFFRVFFFRV